MRRRRFTSAAMAVAQTSSCNCARCTRHTCSKPDNQNQESDASKRYRGRPVRNGTSGIRIARVSERRQRCGHRIRQRCLIGSGRRNQLPPVVEIGRMKSAVVQRGRRKNGSQATHVVRRRIGKAVHLHRWRILRQIVAILKGRTNEPVIAQCRCQRLAMPFCGYFFIVVS
jgi:hypothetical protein